MGGNGDGVEVLVFASRDSVHAAEAQALAQEVGGRYIDRLAGTIDELLLVGRYNIVEPVAVVVLREGRVVARFPRLVTRGQLEHDLPGAV